MKRSNGFILAAVILLLVLPLWWGGPSTPGAKGASVERFAGADAQAQKMIATLAPGYTAWFQPVLAPASSEIASLLFALQAALGAGVIGFWLGVSVTREKQREASQKPQSTDAHHRAD